MKAVIIKSVFIGKMVFIKTLFITTIFSTLSGSSIGSTIFSSIWSLIMRILKDIANSFGSLISMAFSGFGQSVIAMFQTFGFSMSGYGVWAPVMFVIGLGAAVFIGYIFFDLIDAEKDITGFENDV